MIINELNIQADCMKNLSEVLFKVS